MSQSSPHSGHGPSVCVIAPDLAGGGTTRVYLVANALQKIGCDVTVIGAQFGLQLYPVPPQNLKVKPIKATRSLKYAIALKNLLKSINADIIYAIKPRATSFGTALIKAKITHKPLLLDIDDWEMSWHRRPYRPGLKQLIRDTLPPNGALHNPEHLAYLEWMETLTDRADAITTSTRFLQDKFNGHYLPNSKDTELFDPANYDPASSREKYGLTGYRILMFPGTARPHKGLEDVLMALDLVNQPDLRLVIVGGRNPDSYEDDLLERWGKWLIKLPRFPMAEMAQVVSAAHVVVVPQRDYATARAQFPLKLTDGMAMAKPILSTTVGDIPEILTGCAYLTAPESPQQLATQLIAIFDNYESATELGAQARTRCIEHYSLKAMATRLAKLLSDMGLLDIPPNIGLEISPYEPCASNVKPGTLGKAGIG